MTAASNNKNNNMALMAATAAATAPAAATDESSCRLSDAHADTQGGSSDIAHPVVAESNADNDHDDEELDAPPDWIRPLLRGMDNRCSYNVDADGIECSNSANTSSVRAATIRRFDDGHIPERFANSRKEHPTRIVEYVRKKFGTTTGENDQYNFADADNDKNTRQCFVFNDAFPQHIVDELYRLTCNNCCTKDGNDDDDDNYRKSYPAWGAYVTYQQIKQYWKQQQEGNRRNTDSQDGIQQQQHDTTRVETDMLYVETAARYLEYALMKLSNSHRSPSKYTHYKFNTHDKTMKMTTSMTNGHCRDAVADAEKLQVDDDDDDIDRNPLFSSDDLSFVHGVAIWGLRADVGSQVPYHLDYAEQIRYTTNVIVPPVLAGTLQCTSQQINGGSFHLSMEGISHYEQHGYKCKLSPLEGCSLKMKDEERQDQKSKNVVFERNQDDFEDKKGLKNNVTNLSDRHSGIVNIPYKYNQLIVHSGDLPHWSTKIESIGDGDDDSDDGDDRNMATKAYRVIVGFNVFPGGGVGERVQAAPEHSKAFRQLVSSRKTHHKSLDDLSGLTRPLQEKLKKHAKQLLSATDLCRNKPLGRLLVKAKREQDRKNFKLGQEWLEQNLRTFLPANVQDLLNLFSVSLDGNKTDESIEENSNEQAIPRLHPDDVLVFISHKVRDGTFRVVDSSSDSNQKPKQLVSMKTKIALVS